MFINQIFLYSDRQLDLYPLRLTSPADGMLRLLQRLLRGFWNRGAYKLSPPAHLLKKILKLLTGFAPFSTFLIISLLTNFTYQVSVLGITVPSVTSVQYLQVLQVCSTYKCYKCAVHASVTSVQYIAE